MSESATTSQTWRGLPIEYVPQFPGANGQPRSLKASEEVARRIVDDLIDRGYRVGDRFPSETDMLEEYDVSRESLREGLRLLEVQGLITIRRGPGGGPFVAPVNAAYLARSASLFFHVAGATYEEVFDAWHTLEPAVVGRLAGSSDRRVEEAMRPFLTQPSGRPSDEQEYFDAATNFHGVISRLNDNRVLVLLSQTIEHIVTERIVEDLNPLQAQETIDDDHIGIARAIIRGHTKGAQKLAHEHIEHIRSAFHDANPHRGGEIVKWR